MNIKKAWWHDKVAYQIYPKSFADSNGDGIGDIPGIISHLDDLKSLGIDILWLSPCFPSPFADEGYDISDYYNIEPRFGTLDDLDQLIAQARERDMSVILDLVVNHCSDEHEWFKKACEDPEGPYGKFFYILPHTEGEPLPTNWRSYFGGPVWEPLPGHPEYVYLHVFHKKQPDLNWENPLLRQEIYKMINFWLDRGIAGFRIDAIINIKKALPMVSYPADQSDGMCAVQTMLKHAEGVLDFLDEMAENTFIPHHAFAIAELFDNKDEDLPRYIGKHGCFSSIFDFAPSGINQSADGWYKLKHVSLEQYRDVCFASQAKFENIGIVSNIIENHDQPRGVSHYLPEGEHSDTAKKMLGGLSFMLKGLPFLYQGQELGMENTTFTSINDVDDVCTYAQYDIAIRAGLTPEEALTAVAKMSRDNARTPYQWSAGKNAGFTTGTPWLRINPNYKTINFEQQQKDPDSVWRFYQKLAALRHNPVWSETITYGKTIPYMKDEPGIMAYWRTGSVPILVLANITDAENSILLPALPTEVLISNTSITEIKSEALSLLPYQFMVLAMPASVVVA